MSKDDVVQLQEDYKKKQAKITAQWKAIAHTYPLVIEDLNEFVDGLRENYRNWGEEQEIYGAALDDHRIAALLQLSKGCNIVRTYITSRIDQDVAQPIKSK